MDRVPIRIAGDGLAGLSAAVLRFPRGVAQFRVRGCAAATNLFEGTLQPAGAIAQVDGGVVSVQFRKSPFGWRAKQGELLLNTSVAWQVELTGGCSRFEADLLDYVRARHPQMLDSIRSTKALPDDTEAVVKAFKAEFAPSKAAPAMLGDAEEQGDAETHAAGGRAEATLPETEVTREDGE